MKKRWKKLAILVALPIVLYAVVFGGQALRLNNKLEYNRGISLLCVVHQDNREILEELSLSEVNCRKAERQYRKAGIAACNLNRFLPFNIMSEADCRNRYGLSRIGGQLHRLPVAE